MRWVSFAQSDSLNRSIVHLLPTTRGGIGAQGIGCTIELFGDRAESAVVSIDGMRLNQPDGIRLDEAFLRLKEGGNSLVGVVVTLEPSQHKSDLRNSSCLMEIFSRERAVRFSMPLRDEQYIPAQTIPIYSDRLTQTSLIVVNGGSQFNEISVNLAHAEHQEKPASSTPLHISSAPMTVAEYAMASLVAHAPQPFSLSWGEVTVAPAQITSELAPDVACFLVYREVGTQRIMSAVHL